MANALEEARRLEIEALRQKDLLCNTSSGGGKSSNQQGDSDFYPYRYFASEGFLPGYNFPRLPVQAFMPTGKETSSFLSRPRFLALSEFGPRNVIYHEGGKYRVTRVLLPGGGIESRLVSAKLCQVCGYFHEGQATRSVDLCEYCGSRLDANNSLSTRQLFEMTTVATQRIERITSEEEERTREGFFITSHFRFAAQHPIIAATTTITTNDNDNHDERILFELTYGPAATLWRINHRWRRSTTDGFTLDTKKGVWAKKPGEESDNPLEQGQTQQLANVRLLVRDTRNLLLVRPSEQTENPEFNASLQYALQRGIEAVFQVEEQELASERIGQGLEQRIMFWEATEGGIGVLSRLAQEPAILARVAKAALQICHFDEEGQEIERSEICGQACYQCLLSYSNQGDHALLKRHLIKDFLLELASSHTKLETKQQQETTNLEVENSRYQTLLGQVVAHSFTYDVLQYLQKTGRNLPDLIQPQLEEDAGEAKPDFYYEFETGSFCVFCDETWPLSSIAKAERYDLKEVGFEVIALRKDRDLEEQLGQYARIFGVPTN